MTFHNFFIFIFIACAAFVGCKNNDNSELAHHHHDHEHEGHQHSHGHAPKDEHGDESADEITLDEATADLFGLTTEHASRRPMNIAYKAGAKIDVSLTGETDMVAPTSGIVSFANGIYVGTNVNAGQSIATVRSGNISGDNTNAAAKADLESTKDEYDRIKNLYEDRLVTKAEYNQAKAAYERAKANYSEKAASGKVISAISGVITSIDVRQGEYVEPGTLIAKVSSSNQLTVTALIPLSDYRKTADANDARIILPSGETVLLSDIRGQRIGAPSVINANGGYAPISFSVNANTALMPGQSVDIILLSPSRTETIAVKKSALSEQQGTYFVYERLDEDCYRKIPVTLGADDGEYIEIKSGLKGGENIVVNGVAAVRLAQSSGAVPEGHSHSH